MKIINEYVDICKHVERLEQERGLTRVRNKPKLIKLRHQKEEIEQKIIRNIKNYLIPYETVAEELHKNGVTNFLEFNDELNSFLIKQEISKDVGFDAVDYQKRINKFTDLCIKAWDDYIITTKEREKLNEYCKKHKIDKLKQNEIEKKIFKEIYSDNIDLHMVIEHYYKEENLSKEEIKSILSEEYKCEVPLEKIVSIIKDFDDELIENDENRIGKSKLMYTIHFSNKKSVYVVCVNGNLNSDKDFEIGFVTNDPNSFRILIGKSHCENVSNDRIIDIITDGICYYLSTDRDIDNFLVMKPVIRASVLSKLKP